MIRRTFIVVAVLLSIHGVSRAQVSVSLGPNMHAGKIGLGLDGITGSPNFLLKYFFNNQFAGQLILGADVDSPGGDAPAGQTKVTGITMRAGASLLYHLTQDQVSPYIGVEGIFQNATQAGFYAIEPDAKNTIIVAAILGGEYFPNEQFSLGIKHALGVAMEMSRDLPKEETDIRFSTSTLVTGRFYFN
ncbi:MAG: hypothetical protein ACKVRP_00755 [Bacteroidota bacterium]